MDLSNYVSELIKQHGKLNVPGLGYFVHLRKASHYDKETGTLYPPYYETIFDSGKTDTQDNTLVAYIAEKRTISNASARFFLDKYIENIRERAEVAEFDFDDLGSFYIDDAGKVAFKASRSENAFGSDLFGYPPIGIQKLADLGQPVKQRVVKHPQALSTPATPIKEQFSNEGPVKVTNVKPAAPTEIIPEPVQETPSVPPAEDNLDAFDDDDTEAASNLKYWIIGAGVLILAVVAVLYYYKYYEPQSTVKSTSPSTTIHQDAAPSTTVKIDSDTTAQKDSIPPLGAEPVTVTDSASKAAAQTVAPVNGQPVAVTGPMSEIPKNTWLIVGGTYANLENATRTLTKYRAMGYPQARLLDSLPRKEYFLYKIIFGYRYTQKDADAARTEILKPRKLKPKYITVQPYK